VEARFSAPFQTGPGAHPVSCTMGTRGNEGPGRDADPLPPSSAVGHERVELYLYTPYGPYGLYRASVPVQGCTLPFLPPIKGPDSAQAPEIATLSLYAFTVLSLKWHHKSETFFYRIFSRMIKKKGSYLSKVNCVKCFRLLSVRLWWFVVYLGELSVSTRNLQFRLH
jgi:hypothetical protein